MLLIQVLLQIAYALSSKSQDGPLPWHLTFDFLLSAANAMNLPREPFAPLD
jgi:hypothetical protein